MLQNAYRSIYTCIDRAGVRLLVPCVSSITIKGANFIRALNLNFQLFSCTLLIQNKFVNYS